MKRRAFLTTTATSAVTIAGCSALSKSDAGSATDTPNAGQSWPAQREDSNITHTGRQWDGGYRGTRKRTLKFRANGVPIEVVGVLATTQIGIYTGDPIDGNTEDIPSTKFDWYRAPEGSFLWTLTINPIGSGSSENLPPIDHWSALPVLERGNEQPKKPLTETYDPNPVYYRLPLMVDGGLSSTTSPAYRIGDMTGNALDTRKLVFEVRSHAVEFAFGNPPEIWWSYSVA